MEASVKRTNSQRSQNNDNYNGPRVSFNKDVHVKRIGNRPNEIQHFIPNGGSNATHNPLPPLKRELPQDLSEKELLKEAAKVIAQAERIKCTVDTPKSIAGVRIKDKEVEDTKFSSLPNRRKKTKPLNRSVSDASHKKPKRPSIFNIFSKRSDPNLSNNTNNSHTNNSGSNNNNNNNYSNNNAIGDPSSGKGNDIITQSVNKKRNSRPVGRSKSDVGYTSSGSPIANKSDKIININIDRKRINTAENDEPLTKSKKKAQLSPIIENPPQEKFFGFSPAEQHQVRALKSEEKTQHRGNSNKNNFRRYANDDSDLMSATLPRQSKSFSPNYSKSLESLHSSQLPQEKLPLTKGLKVDGMVKRLSMERFSPPPQMSSPAFSYTRPNEPIVYAQVVRDGNGDDKTAPKQTIHSNVNSMIRKSPVNAINKDGVRSSPFSTAEKYGTDTVDYQNSQNRHKSPSQERQYGIYEKDSSSPVRLQSPPRAIKINYSPNRNYSDEDEGLGYETRRNYAEEDLIPTRDTRQSSCEPPIIPKFRPGREHLIELGNRRRMLESKINSRTTPREIIHPVAYNKVSPGRQPLPANDEPYPADIPSSPSRKHWPKQQKFYPETNVEDDFCDSPRFKHERNRIKRQVFEENQRNKKLSSSPNRVIDLGYIDQYRDNYNGDYKPSNKFIETTPQRNYVDGVDRFENRNQFSTLEREKHKYRSFDKGDSGIENDFKRDKESNKDDIATRNREYHAKCEADRQITALFLKRERRHTEITHSSKRRSDYVYRERSIDDGSHFDPRLDKYPQQDTLKRNPTKKQASEDGSKGEKKFGTLKKVKELFMPSKKKQTEKETFMVPAEEMQQRYKEYKENSPARPELKQITDIKTRRRLSTPKASPLPKRIPSQKSSKISHVSSHQSSDISSSPAHKTGWFKSLERLSRKKAKAERTPESDKWTSPSSMTSKSQTPNSRQMTPGTPVSPVNKANLRFFGDTDLESDANMSRAITTTTKARKSLNHKLSHSVHELDQDPPKPLSKASSRDKLRSTSLQQLNNTPTHGRKQAGFRSKYLQDLSESSTENENNHMKNASTVPNGADPKYKHRRQYHSSEHLQQKSHPTQSPPTRTTTHRPLQNESSVEYCRSPSPYEREIIQNGHSQYRDEKKTLTKSREGINRYPLRENLERTPNQEPRKPILGPTKPARSMNRHRAFSSDRALDSSGTEGDSSQQSVVYLHATTVGHIPQPYVLNSRRSSKSREELSSIKNSKTSTPQPMTRTVSRSISMLAPWTPKRIDDGYEINYSQTMEHTKKKTNNSSSSKKENVHKSRNSKEDTNSSLVSAATLSKRNNNGNAGHISSTSSRYNVKK